MKLISFIKKIEKSLKDKSKDSKLFQILYLKKLYHLQYYTHQ